MGDRCRSCGQPVIWAVTEAGKRMPVDAQVRLDGNLVLEGDKVRAVKPGEGRWVSHFAVCRDSESWRKPR